MSFITTSRGILSEVVVLFVLSTTTVVLRFIARHKQKNAFGVDDYLILSAWLLFVGLSIADVYSIAQGGLGSSTPDFFIGHDSKVIESFEVIVWVSFLLSLLGLGFTRLSALLFYRRIFVNKKQSQSPFGIVTIIGIIVTVLWMASFLITQAIGCGPYGINPALQCKRNIWYLVLVTTSSALDIMVLVLPFPKIWSLQMRTTQKLALSLVFLLATIGTAASITRLVLTVLIELSLYGDSTGFFGIGSVLYYSVVLEAGIGLVAVNLPSLRSLFVGVTPRGFWQEAKSLIHLRSQHPPVTEDSVTLEFANVGLSKAPVLTYISSNSDIELEASTGPKSATGSSNFDPEDVTINPQDSDPAPTNYQPVTGRLARVLNPASTNVQTPIREPVRSLDYEPGMACTRGYGGPRP